MTYYELFTKAENLLIKNKITLGEYDKMVQPLNDEVRKVGRWIEAKSGIEYRCSECGEYVDKITIMGKSYQYNYCPNCGTRMKEDLDSINSCYKCAHAGTAPYDKPCSVCARNHRDHFEKREDPNAFDGK